MTENKSIIEKVDRALGYLIILSFISVIVSGAVYIFFLSNPDNLTEYEEVYSTRVVNSPIIKKAFGDMPEKPEKSGYIMSDSVEFYDNLFKITILMFVIIVASRLGTHHYLNMKKNEEYEDIPDPEEELE